MTRGLDAGVVFHRSMSILEVLRDSIRASIRDIETHARGRLLQRFLKEGPYESDGTIPPELIERRLSDHDTALAVRFIYCFMVNSFQGALAELLALGPCLELLERLQGQGAVPRNARLHVGDAVRAAASGRPAVAKAADLHILADDGDRLVVAGVAEVKSYSLPWTRVALQLDKHLRRAALGLQVGTRSYSGNQVTVGGCAPAARIGIFPSQWKLSRRFHFEQNATGRELHVERRCPPMEADQIERSSDTDWRITLRWSQEALAEAAYAMTFWYMEKVGQVIYAAGVPKDWSRMTSSEAGINAAKMMLNYAIGRTRTSLEYQRAVALYNNYCFGYALGMNFRDDKGQREMLCPEDLDEILESGQTKPGCRISS